MTDLGAVLEQLKRERTKLDQAIIALSGIVGGKSGSESGRAGKRHLSVAARKRIAEAQRARWAKFKAKKRTQK
jgi:nicotinamide mononucleotide (NMN) deamidase PncC